MLEHPPTVLRRPVLRETHAAAETRPGSTLAAIELLPPRTRFTLRLDPGLLHRASTVGGFPLDLPINRCVVAAGRRSMRLGPDEWLLWCQPKEENQILREVGASLLGLHHALVDIGHAQVVFSVSGSKAEETMNAGCPLDLHHSAFPAGMATRTLLGKAEIILSRWEDRPAFEVECGRSYASYVSDFLHRAAQQYLAQT
jgi:sarcosine oxidase, subunit gamma